MTRPRRILGLTFDGRAVFEPADAGSSLVLAAAGGGKTTCAAMPSILSMLSDRETAIVISDVKAGEIAAQIAPVCAKYGRPFAVIDEFGERPELAQYRVSLNPFGDLVGEKQRGLGELLFKVENISHALKEEPADDAKNFYWREGPRKDFIENGIHLLVERNPRLATPGGLTSLLSDPEMWDASLRIAIEEGDERLKAAARQVLALKNNNPEHYSQHLNAALTALKIFADGPLKEAGRVPSTTHRELIENAAVVCFINPVRHVDRLGPYFALHFLALLGEKLADCRGRMELILDEFTNAPLRDALKRITIQRAFGVRTHFLAQSRQDVVRKYGERETAILEENCTIKQWLKFSNFEEAERVSKAMGERTNVSTGIGLSTDKMGLSGNLSTGRGRIFTAEELMRLPPNEQILHVSGVGFIHCLKIRQNQIWPYCDDLGDNPLEGRRMVSDPKVRLTPPRPEARS